MIALSPVPNTYRLYHYPLDPHSRRVRLTLAKKASSAISPSSVRGIRAPISSPATRPAKCRFLSVTDGKHSHVLADVCAICEYIEETHPSTQLLGKDPLARAEVRRLVGWFERKFHGEVTAFLLGEKALKTPDRPPASPTAC